MVTRFGICGMRVDGTEGGIEMENEEMKNENEDEDGWERVKTRKG